MTTVNLPGVQLTCHALYITENCCTKGGFPRNHGTNLIGLPRCVGNADTVSPALR